MHSTELGSKCWWAVLNMYSIQFIHDWSTKSTTLNTKQMIIAVQAENYRFLIT